VLSIIKKNTDKNHILASSEVHFHSPSSDILYYIQWLKWVLQKGTGCLRVHTSMD